LNKNGSISQKSLNAIFNKKVVVYGGGRKGSYGGMNGDLIIELNIDTEKANSITEAIHGQYPIRPSAPPRPRPSRTQYPPTPSSFPVPPRSDLSDFSDLSNIFRNAFSSHESAFETKPERNDYVPPVSVNKPSKDAKFWLKTFSIIGILVVLLGLRIHSVNLKKAQENTAWDVCSYQSTIQQDVEGFYFTGYEDPWAAALYFGYFKPDLEYPDQTSYESSSNELASSYVERVQALEAPIYAELKYDFLEFESRLSNNDKSFGKYAKKLESDCNYLDSHGGFFS
jgi:hypothetical protein